MNIDHIGLYVNDLEKTKRFFETYFHATSNELYHNKTTGLKTYFLSFDNHTRLEIMHRPNLSTKAFNELRIGYHHIAFKLGAEKKVDEITEVLQSDGYEIVSGPRRTGDGYYEAVFKLEHYLIELVA
jgi:lactoylglutathione lyase